MNIINFSNLDVNLLNKYNIYFLLGKEISLINDMEESIIQYLNTNNFIKIYRDDLNLKLNIYELQKKILVKDLFYSTNLIILRAEEIWWHSAPLKNFIVSFHKLIPLNYFLIVKTYLLKTDIYPHLLNTIFFTIKPLIINCKIDNSFNEVNSWLVLRTKSLNLNLSPIIYKYLYSCYENDVYKLYKILKIISLQTSPLRLIYLNKILFRHERTFTLQHLLKYLSQGDLYILWSKLFALIYYNKEDKLLSIFYEFKSLIIRLTKKLLTSKYKHILGYNNHDNLNKIIKLLNFKKLYFIIKLLNNLEVYFSNRFLSSQDKSHLIYDKIIQITILMIY